MAKRVLTVDDSRTMREMVAFTLGKAGFEVSEAEDGRHALKVLQAVPADVVITDLNMPNMDGVALIRALRADPKWRAVPILMLTTESDAGKKADGKNAGATGWLVKPFDPAKLIDIVKRVCG
ncbi:response regulator [Dankookia sp. GCM10030260]|uniref:response regulator n=1 Tax=Dankookia sp. GCM10030260 TaxID=3273390 RepID=UPI00360F28FE